MDDDKKVRKNISITEKLDEQLRREAFETRLSESEIIRRALEAWFEKGGGKNG